MRACCLLLPVLAVIGCATTPKPVPPPVAKPIAPRAVKAGPVGSAPSNAVSSRYTLDIHARAELAGRRATVEWTLKVASLGGEQRVDLYLDAPPGIAIDALWLDVVEGTLSEGRVAPAWSAAEVYERVTAQRIDPALLERVDDTRYRLRVFPLTRARLVRLRYHAILPATAEGMILQVPRPALVGEPQASPNSLRVEVTDTQGTLHATDRFALTLPYDARRAEFAIDGTHRISQWQFVPTRHTAGEIRPMIAALDTGRESPDTPPLFEFAACVRGSIDTSACTDAGPRRIVPKGATDLLALLKAAVPWARGQTGAIGLVTGGHDRWRDLTELVAALPADVPVHVQATPGANLGVLSRLAEQGRGHLMLRSSSTIHETKITDLRIEMLAGEADWLDVPHSHVLGTPIVLTARHTGPIRVRLHGRVGIRAFVANLPTTRGPAQPSIVPVWRRAQVEESPHETAGFEAHLVTRATSLAVFEREQDYVAAQTGNPDLAGPPVRPMRVRVNGQRVEVREKIYFKSGSAQIAPASLEIINAVAQVARENRTLRFALIGHTDARERHADALSLRRAAAVHRVLLAQGVLVTQMSFHGHAATQPLMRNTATEGRARNRRVEFQVHAFEGKTWSHDYRAPSKDLRDGDRIAFVKALLSQKNVQPRRFSSARDRLRGLREQLTDGERIAYFYWVFRPNEIDAEIDRIDIDALPEWAQPGLIQVLVDRKDWTRLMPRSQGRLHWLSPAELAQFMAEATPPIHVVCQHEMAVCARALYLLAEVSPERAQQFAGFALRMLPKPPLSAFKYARPEDEAIPFALTAQLAHPAVTADDFRRVSQWAATLKRPDVACRAHARANQLGRTQTARPKALDCPNPR